MRDITLALAGICQASVLIKDLALHGTLDQHAFETTINSIYQLEPIDVLSVYQDKQGVRLGLNQLKKLFFGKFDFDEQEIGRYLLSIIQIERKLMHNESLVQNLHKSILQVTEQSEFFEPTHPMVIKNIASIYTETANNLGFRIKIYGESQHLNIHENMEKARALLLAGIRSAVLWRQVGGNRFHLFLSRKKILDNAEELLVYTHDT